MKLPLALCAAAVCSLPSARVLAVTATGLSSFEGMEQPAQRYIISTRSFEPEVYQAITDEGGGLFRMTLRYGTLWWDGDRDTGNRDRQRAEVKGLGPHQKIGETFEYATTWRVDAGFHGTTRFWHVFQLKATEGDDGAPLITMSLGKDPDKVSVKYWSGNARDSKSVREFRMVPGEWESVRIRVKTSFKSDGEVLVSVNGDPFVGVEGVAVFRPDASDYRPKWGLYRGLTAGMSLTDDYVEHRDVSARNMAGPAVENAPLESEARQRAAKSIPDAIAWLEAQPTSAERNEAIGAIAVLWEETDPQAAIGWAFTKADPSAKAQTLLRVYDHWQVRDSDAALTWLSGHAPDPDLDQVLWFQATDTSFRHGLTGQALTRYASMIASPKLRMTAFEFTLPRWSQEPGQRDAAIQYLQTTTALEPSERVVLQAKL